MRFDIMNFYHKRVLTFKIGNINVILRRIVGDIIGLSLIHIYNICTTCNAGVQRQPAGLVAHDLNAHHAAVAACGGVNAVDHIGGNVHGLSLIHI